MRAVKPLPQPPADFPAPFDLADVVAIQAVYHGTASPDQQRRAMLWIMRGAAMVNRQSYRPGDSHATAFVDGRRFVGLQILAITDLNPNDLKEQGTTNGDRT